MKKAIYLLTAVISFSTLSILLTVHHIGKAGSYAFANNDFIGGYVFAFMVCIIFCIYKYIKSTD